MFFRDEKGFGPMQLTRLVLSLACFFAESWLTSVEDKFFVHTVRESCRVGL